MGSASNWAKIECLRTSSVADFWAATSFRLHGLSRAPWSASMASTVWRPPDESSLATRSRMGARPCSSGAEGDAYRASIIDALLFEITGLFLAMLFFTGARGKKFQTRSGSRRHRQRQGAQETAV